MEASGTGNMKLALNGALTIGTFDGANVEICEHVGRDNLFIFGLNADEVDARRKAGTRGLDAIDKSPLLRSVLDQISLGEFSPDEPDRFQLLIDDLTGDDHFMVAADFDAYWSAQRAADALWARPTDWWRASILNTARMGWFSSDRAILEYAEDIWGIDGSIGSARAAG
jgi:starch phosphorylase